MTWTSKIMLKLSQQLFFIRRLVVLTALETENEAWNLQINLFSSISPAKIWTYKLLFTWITKWKKLKISCENNKKNIQKQSPRGFLTKWQNGIQQICSKFTGEHPKLPFKFMKTTHMHGYCPVNSLHVSRTPLGDCFWILRSIRVPLKFMVNDCSTFTES